MKQILREILRFAPKIPLLVIILLAFVAGYALRGVVTREVSAPVADTTDETTARVTDWTCSMHPQIHLPEPGQCPICGMDLIPAHKPAKPEAGKDGKQPLYACPMFCVPPQPRPGKCPICGMEMVEVDVEEEGQPESAGAPTLTLSPTAQKLARVETAPVERRFASAEVRMVGQIDYDETRLRYITAWVPGRLDRLYVDYTGIRVRKGDHLVDLYSPELLTAQTELLEALKAAREVRGGENGAAGDPAGEWVETIRDKFRLWGLTEEQIAEIEARGTPSDHITIYAPIGGVVIHKDSVEGMYVQTGTRIYTIADLSRVWIKLEAYESDLAWLRYGQKVEFETEAYPGETFAGTIAFIDPVLDARTRTVKMRINAENPDGRLKPGMFVRAVVRAKIATGGRVVNAELAGKWISPMHPEVVKDHPGTCDVCGMPLVPAESLGFVSIESGEAEPPLVIPASAPLQTGKRALVYVELPDKPGTYEGREVTLGPRAGDFYVVRDGLSAGERVVVKGNFRIDSAMQILARPSMMNPQGDGAPSTHHHGNREGPGDGDE